MGIKHVTWYFLACNGCGYSPHVWSAKNPLPVAAFESLAAAEFWALSHNWQRVGDNSPLWYCPDCAKASSVV